MLVSNSRFRGLQSSTSIEANQRATMGLLDLRGFWLLLRRRAGLIGACLCAALLLAGALLYLIVPQYAATTVVLVDPRQQKVVQSEAVLAGIGSDAAAVESQVEVIRSATVVRRLIDKLSLTNDPEFAQPGIGARIRAMIGIVGEEPRDPAARVAVAIQDRLWVQRRGLTYVIEIGFRSQDPAKAARIANAIANEYLTEQTSAKQGATSTASTWLEGRIAELSERVTRAERAIAAFKASHNIVGTGEGRTLAERQISELNQQLVLARARTAETRARFEQVRRASPVGGEAGTPPEALSSPVIANLRTQYAQAARTEVEITSTYGPRHPALQTTTAQMADLRRQIEREIARISAGLRNEYEAAVSREKSLDASLAALKKQAAGTDQDTVELRELEREAAASRTLLEQFLARAKETTEQQTLQTPDARIISPASPPLVPSFPRPGLLLAVAFAGGLILGIGSATIAESLGRGFRTIADVESLVGRPVLAVLPKPDARRRASGSFAERIHALRASLQQGSATRPQILLVSSAVPNEGASLVALSLAEDSVKAGEKTLLIKTGAQRASTPQLTTTDAGSTEPQQQSSRIRSLIRTDKTGLHLLAVGTLFRDGAPGGFNRAEFAHMLSELRRDYPTIILDAPAILANADNRRLLDYGDSAIIAVRWAKTDGDSVAAALKLLEDNAEKVAGIVLTGVNLRKYRLYDETRPFGV
jgi:succinoglycan biosynthesis transport protein ExoP